MDVVPDAVDAVEPTPAPTEAPTSEVTAPVARTVEDAPSTASPRLATSALRLELEGGGYAPLQSELTRRVS